MIICPEWWNGLWIDDLSIYDVNQSIIYPFAPVICRLLRHLSLLRCLCRHDLLLGQKSSTSERPIFFCWSATCCLCTFWITMFFGLSTVYVHYVNYLHYMFIICSLYVHYMFIICLLYVHYDTCLILCCIKTITLVNMSGSEMIRWSDIFLCPLLADEVPFPVCHPMLEVQLGRHVMRCPP